MRTGSAIALAAIALTGAYLGGVPLAIVWAVAGAAVAYECATVTSPEENRSLSLAMALAVTAAALAPLMGQSGLAFAAGGVLSAVMFGRFWQDRLWAVVGLAFGLVLAVVPPLVRADASLGLAGLLWMFGVVWATDIAAYFTGRTLGGPRLWPRVSPKKTWSGFIGGTLAGTLAGVLVMSQLGGWSVSPMLVLGSAIASVVSQGGDLAESALKRHVGVKDSGSLIPGHGGFMDRLDGFWAVSVLVALGLLASRVVQ